MSSDPAVAATPARLPRRLAAIVYDSLLLAGVLFAATALALGLTVAVLGGESVRLHHPLQGSPWLSTYLLLVCFFFFGGFWVYGGQTLGMRAWRLRVQRRDGRGIGWWQALLRFLSAGIWPVPIAAYLDRALGVGVGLSLVAGFGGLALALALRLPDRLSETELVVLPKKSKA
ncbi:MAG: RDD family protein [Candidatus Competibacter sp.]|nr:RDD family protein [Candidatus Competibacter sp.]